MSAALPTPSSSALLGQIPDAARCRRYLPALTRFFGSYAAYLAYIAGAMVLPGWLLKAVCVFAAAGAISRIYVVGHDAGHGSLVPGRRLNRWIARFALFPAYAPLASWHRSHVLLHHNFLRVRGRDMAWVPWSLDDYRRATVWQRAWYRFLRTPAGLSFYWTTGNWLPHLLFPPNAALGKRLQQFQLDRFLVAGFAVGHFIVFNALTRSAAVFPWAEPVSPLGVFLLGLVLPYLLWTYLIGLTDLLHHTHPRSICFADPSEWNYFDATVRSTVHLTLPFGLSRLTNNILEHTAHHVDPRVPLYNLPEVQGQLEAAYPEDIAVERLTLGYVLRILRTCRLYDYERRQWLDYDGTPSSPALR
jgi:acyl-lipid omega-6 desaturase (Delta-12 desaturase)